MILHMFIDMRRRSQNEINSRVYHSPGVAGLYTGTLLNRAETMALLKYREAFVGRNVLDVGVGTGRTAAYLKPLARHYVGIDYSQEMIDYLRRTQPEVEAHLTDMRDLSAWGAGAFDFVFAPNNVIDAVSHDDRVRVLAEVRRVLSDGGLLVLTSHNRRYRLAESGPRLEYSRNPVIQAQHVARYLRRRLNHLRIGGLRRFEEEYALLNDIGHHYGLLHYYIDCDHQAAQLDAAGFRVLDVIDARARSLRSGDDDSDSSSLLYVVTRK
jgi:SAM-dependent methyltransferase